MVRFLTNLPIAQFGERPEDLVRMEDVYEYIGPYLTMLDKSRMCLVISKCFEKCQKVGIIENWWYKQLTKKWMKRVHRNNKSFSDCVVKTQTQSIKDLRCNLCKRREIEFATFYHRNCLIPYGTLKFTCYDCFMELDFHAFYDRRPLYTRYQATGLIIWCYFNRGNEYFIDLEDDDESYVDFDTQTHALDLA